MSEKPNDEKFSKSKFRFCGKACILTYKTHLTKPFLCFLDSYKHTHKIIWETGSTGYDHTHVIIFFAKKHHFCSARKFDVNGIHPNIKMIKTKEHWENAANYEKATKKDGHTYKVISNTLTGNEYMWLGSVRQAIQSHATWQDVINDDSLETYLQKYFRWATEVWACRPKVNYTENAVLKNWQKKIVCDLEKQNDDQVLWVCDPKGGNGKSFLTNYLLDRGAFFCNNGKLSDVAFAYNYEKVVIFDLPRTTRDCYGKDWTPYRAMEMFKDGRLFSPKYQSQIKRFPSAKVVIFANFAPDESAMSSRRWDIRSLNNDILSSESALPIPHSDDFPGTSPGKSSPIVLGAEPKLQSPIKWIPFSDDDTKQKPKKKRKRKKKRKGVGSAQRSTERRGS